MKAFIIITYSDGLSGLTYQGFSSGFFKATGKCFLVVLNNDPVKSFAWKYSYKIKNPFVISMVYISSLLASLLKKKKKFHMEHNLDFKQLEQPK